MARIFSGIQPSGELHIGNYLGAVRHWVELQSQHESFICIVDYHAITQPYDVDALEPQTMAMAIGLLAAGIDPSHSVLFVQSHVPEHTELNWVFNSVTPVGHLERMTQYKEKSQRQFKEKPKPPRSSTVAVSANRPLSADRPIETSVPVGLLNYPVLQAADVLLYKADLVPVGEDQIQHVELMREIARKWNARYSPGFFPEPDSETGQARRIIGLDGQAKMSKSLGNTVGILDEPDEIWERIRPAVTDPARITKRDPGTPEKCNVYSLHQYFSPPDTVEEVATKCRTAGWGCIDCKRVLSDNIATAFAPMRERARDLDDHPKRMLDVLADGAAKAQAIATDTMRYVRSHMGFLPKSRETSVSS